MPPLLLPTQSPSNRPEFRIAITKQAKPTDNEIHRNNDTHGRRFIVTDFWGNILSFVPCPKRKKKKKKLPKKSLNNLNTKFLLLRIMPSMATSWRALSRGQNA